MAAYCQPGSDQDDERPARAERNGGRSDPRTSGQAAGRSANESSDPGILPQGESAPQVMGVRMRGALDRTWIEVQPQGSGKREGRQYASSALRVSETC